MTRIDGVVRRDGAESVPGPATQPWRYGRLPPGLVPERRGEFPHARVPVQVHQGIVRPAARRSATTAASISGSPIVNLMEDQQAPRAKFVTLCGSTRFEADFAEVNQRLGRDYSQR
ncbi:hypothetical protein Apa02nite_091600 [Actinoplanes palleronii]|uniref:Uncharacterized protein n=2 Tax=Actinoplanes palleronii TaxID=113570 RepID=A0ABQ4BQW0_9ACTN|nr:hypothetical protein Apa02nite_091600 [Actinoplanes palleronii]